MSLLGDTWDDPRTLGLLAAAQAMMQQRGVGGLLSGATVYGGALAQAKQAERKRQMEDEQRAAMAEDRAMRQQVQQLQFEDAARRRAAEEALAKRGAMDEEVLRRTFAPMTGATVNAGSGLIGPTNEAAAAIGQAPRFDPRSVLAMGGSFDALGKAMKINETLNPAPKLMSVAPGASVLDERNPGRGPVFTAPERPEASPSAVREYEYAKAQGFPGSFLDFQLQQKRAGATNIGMPKIEVKMGEGIASQIGPMLKDSRAQAEAGLRLVDSSTRVLQAAESGNLYAGPMANLKLKGAQVADAFGFAGKDTQEKITNTRNVVRGMAEQAVSARAQLGGQAQISNSEQELLNKATSGDIGELTAREVVQIAALNDRLGRLMYGNHQRQMQTLNGRPELAGIAPFYSVPEMPAAAKPAGEQKPQAGGSRTVARTGKDASGRRVVQYSDGSIEYGP